MNLPSSDIPKTIGQLLRQQREATPDRLRWSALAASRCRMQGWRTSPTNCEVPWPRKA